MNLIKARPGDLETVADFIKRYYEFDHIAYDRDSVVAGLGELLSDSKIGLVWFLEEAGAIVGYSIMTHGFDLEYGGSRCNITDLFLLPEYRGRGLGTKALEMIVDECRTLGLKAVELQVELDNAEARALYEKCGFRAHNRAILYKFL